MKKLTTTVMLYTFLALASGLFYREFTKLNDFSGATTLSIVHVHLFALGTLFFMIVTLAEAQFRLSSKRGFGLFYVLYNVGLAFTVGAFLWRGILQTLGNELTKSLNSAISGVAGVGHILLTGGLILFVVIFQKLLANAKEVLPSQNQ